MANAVEIEHVTMRFNMSKDKVDSIKEYMIRLMKRQLFFEEFFALKDVSLNIEKGDVFGIVGLNGSGTVSYTHLDVYKRQLFTGICQSKENVEEFFCCFDTGFGRKAS